MRKTNEASHIADARKLRKEMTKEERRLWYEFLKQLPVTFHRQKIIGNYILDFYCAEHKIAIELDGYDHFLANGMLYDRQRSKDLGQVGITVLRYSNTDVMNNFEAVCSDIRYRLGLQ